MLPRTEKKIKKIMGVKFQWYACNIIRLLAIPILFISNFHTTTISIIIPINLDAGFFTAGLTIDVISFVICYLCISITCMGNYHHYYYFDDDHDDYYHYRDSYYCHWKMILPFCVYATCEGIFSAYLAYRVFRDRLYFVPFYFGQVSAAICISLVTLACLFKLYHLCLTFIVIIRDIIQRNNKEKRKKKKKKKRNSLHSWIAVEDLDVVRFPPPPSPLLGWDNK